MGSFSSSPEFSSPSVIFGIAARRAQEPLQAAGRANVAAGCALVATAKTLIANPGEAKYWQELATGSKTVTERIKSLVSVVVVVGCEKRERGWANLWESEGSIWQMC